jgi:hypothetical protein
MSEHKDFIDMLNKNGLYFIYIKKWDEFVLIFNISLDNLIDYYNNKTINDDKKIINSDLIPIITEYLTKNNISFELKLELMREEIINIKEEYKEKANRINTINKALKIFDKTDLEEIFLTDYVDCGNDYRIHYNMSIPKEWYDYDVPYLTKDNPEINFHHQYDSTLRKIIENDENTIKI